MEKFLLFPLPARKTRISVKLCTHESYVQTHICRKSPWRGLSIGAIRIGITFHYSNGKIFLFPEEKKFFHCSSGNFWVIWPHQWKAHLKGFFTIYGFVCTPRVLRVLRSIEYRVFSWAQEHQLQKSFSHDWREVWHFCWQPFDPPNQGCFEPERFGHTCSQCWHRREKSKPVSNFGNQFFHSAYGKSSRKASWRAYGCFCCISEKVHPLSFQMISISPFYLVGLAP